MLRPQSRPASRADRRRQQQQQEEAQSLHDSLMDPPSQRVVWEHNEGEDSHLQVAPTSTRSKRGRKTTYGARAPIPSIPAPAASLPS